MWRQQGSVSHLLCRSPCRQLSDIGAVLKVRPWLASEGSAAPGVPSVEYELWLFDQFVEESDDG